ncbi:MAG: PadR family transcriptional regulator [Chloroflexota bacterium]|nr:PadR family transcriptional regulator [Chloroflexota bacterium]
MNEQTLLVLGLLKAQSQHGYQINEFIERNLSRMTDMKKATAYAILERLCKGGYVRVHTEQEGNRPVRKVYSITHSGEEQFMALLRINLSTAGRMTIAGDMGLMFLDHLPLSEGLECLTARLKQVEVQLEAFNQPLTHEGLGVNLTLEHQHMLLQAEQVWLTAVLQRLQSEFLTMLNLKPVVVSGSLAE